MECPKRRAKRRAVGGAGGGGERGKRGRRAARQTAEGGVAKRAAEARLVAEVLLFAPPLCNAMGAHPFFGEMFSHQVVSAAHEDNNDDSVLLSGVTRRCPE